MCLPIINFLYPPKKYFHQCTFMDNESWIMSRGVTMIYLCNNRKIYFSFSPSLFFFYYSKGMLSKGLNQWIYPPPPPPLAMPTNCVCLYIFFTQIWFGECNYLRLKIRIVCVGNLNLKSLLTDFIIPNLSQIYFCITEIFKTNV